MPAAAQTAYVVKVTRADPSPSSREISMLYAVLTDTPENAVEAVRGVVGKSDTVEPVGAALSAETISRLGLLYGQTLRL